MSAVWFPRAVRDLLPDAGAFISGVPFRGVIHTTEGTSIAGAVAAYRKNKTPPHFTVAASATHQHVRLDRAARALMNPPGGVETNRARAIQIEVVARASEPDWPAGLVARVADLMEWLEAELGIKPWAPPFKPYRPGDPPGVSAYGLSNGVRMSGESWQRFDGWCGHQHVPENLHGDPGAIPIDTLLQREAPTVPDIVSNTPPRVILVRPQGDGYWIVAEDGGVFAFGAAPPMTEIGGGANERIISGAVWPDGMGLLLMGADGGVFALGTAVFTDRVHYNG